jgi:hypothetical protein
MVCRPGGSSSTSLGTASVTHSTPVDRVTGSGSTPAALAVPWGHAASAHHQSSMLPGRRPPQGSTAALPGAGVSSLSLKESRHNSSPVLRC